MPEAIVTIGEQKRVVGRLRFETDGRRQHSQFEYADEWLAARDGFALSPGLPMREGGHFANGTLNKRSALSGCFTDAAPDSWGRALMTRAIGEGLSEFDFLVRSDDRTRQGALRFLGDDMEPLSDVVPPIPRLVELEHIRALAQKFERNPGGAEQEARDLAGFAGSGGARPKANVVDNDHLWIAKFTSANDTKSVERAEVATLKLAAKCGLRVAEAELALSKSDSPIALIRRFDRRDQARIPYISARTALSWESEEGAYYTDIADVIRQISSNSKQDLRELWSRIAFTILVSNTDDHLKNHGFIYTGQDKWRLSPAFDVNPSPSRHRMLETGIMPGETFVASLDLALEAAEFFDLKKEEAVAIIKRIAQTTSTSWKDAFRDADASFNDLRGYADAFEHDEVEKALGL